MVQQKNLLITGLPKIGKTTIIRRIVEQLKDPYIVGFYTSEIRERGSRVGFELIGFHGKKGVLSHIESKSPHRVGKYGVNITSFDLFLEELPLSDPNTSFFVIDEIGKMEFFSQKFRILVYTVLDSPTPLIATIALRGDRAMEAIKLRNDVKIYSVTKENRDALAELIVADLKELMKK